MQLSVSDVGNWLRRTHTNSSDHETWTRNLQGLYRHLYVHVHTCDASRIRFHYTELHSNQGTKFVGADARLHALLSEFQTNYSAVFHCLTDEGTNWHFNLPSAPHMGGLWEAAVNSAKFHLRRVIGSQVLIFPELNTVLCRIEATLYSRPLRPLSDNISDLVQHFWNRWSIEYLSFLQQRYQSISI